MSSPTIRAMSKSPSALAREAFRIGLESLSPYSNKFSRRDFQQAQLFAILVLRQFFKTDYRGITQILSEWSDLRGELQLAKIPHFTTLQKAEHRLLKKQTSTASYTASSSLLTNMVL